MRGWVAVQNEQRQKRLQAPSIQDFEGDRTFKPSAHLMETGFQRFESCAMTIPCVMIHSSALTGPIAGGTPLQFNKIPIRD